MSLLQRTRVDLNDLVDCYKVIDYDCLKNGNIVYLFLYNQRKVTQVRNAILAHCEDIDAAVLYSRINRITNRYKTLIHNFDRDWDTVCTFLNTIFSLPSLSSTPKPSTPDIPLLPPTSLSFMDTTPLLQSISQSPPVLKNDCRGCANRRSTYSRLRAAARNFQVRISNKSTRIREIYKKYNVRNVNRFKSRKLTQVERLKSKISDLKWEISTLKSKIQKLELKTNDINKLKRSLRRSQDSAATKVKAVKELLSAKENISPDVSPDNTVMETTNGKQYSLPLRFCLYKSLICNVSTDNASCLVEFIFNRLTGHRLSAVPCSATVAHMAYELSALTYLQTAEFILSSLSPVTLSWDATTVSGSHINEVHVSRENTPGKIETCTLQIEELPGGTALDYSTHISNVFLDVATIYGQLKSLSKDEVYLSLTAKIKSYMTDRCAVNDATARLLKDAFQSELLALKCLVHPLDGIASKARNCLKQMEDDKGLKTKSFGKECAAANVLRALTTLRFKAGSGDPQGMLKFFQDNKVPAGLIVRYVGNRLHILFHLAGVVYNHLDILIRFLNPTNGRDSPLKRALLDDLNVPFIRLELKALGLIGKVITGPWMSAFYRDGNHMDAIPKLQTCFSNLQMFHSKPSLYITTERDVFGDVIDVDSVCCLRSSPSKVFYDILKSLTGALLKVFTRQLASYIPGGVYSSPSAAVLQQASGAPLHNIASERALGMADNAWRRAPNARIGFISGKTAASMNNLLGWLSAKDESEQKLLINTCVNYGYRFHEQWKQRSKQTSEDILKRHQDAKRKKEASDRKALERAMKEAIKVKGLQPLVNHSSSLDFDVQKAEPFIRDPYRLRGILILHAWEDNSTVTVWNGRVRKLKAKKCKDSFHFIAEISYWAQDEDEIEAEDYDVKLEALLCDMALGEMSIVH